MGLTCLLIPCLVLVLVSSAAALESGELQMRDDFGMEPLSDCQLNYYYYTPCPTYSWFQAYYDWEIGDVIGSWFQIGDVSMYTGQACDPYDCHTLEQFRVLDFEGYGVTHPSFYGVEFDIYCCDEYGCPIGPPLWNSGRMTLRYAWNFIAVDPPVSICGCSVNPGSSPSSPRVLITATHLGVPALYPMWGFDDISIAAGEGCEFHEYSCLPAVYPRPYNSHYPTIHTGFYGQDFNYCPPLWFRDGRDTTADATLYGYVELAWRIYLVCSGPTNVEPSTWGGIKSMYR